MEYEQEGGMTIDNSTIATGGPKHNRLEPRRAAIDQALSRMKAAEQNRRACQIPSRFEHSTFSNYEAMTEKQAKALSGVMQYAQTFDERRRRGANLVMVGKPGTGKTHLACALANDLLDKGYKALYRVTPDLLAELKEAAWNHSQAAMMQSCTATDLLVLDEVGVRESTEADFTLLLRLLDKRYREHRPTVVISNLRLEDLERVIGDRVVDRLREDSEPLAFAWESYRGLPADQKRVRRPEPRMPTLLSPGALDQMAEYFAKDVFVTVETLDLRLLPFVVQAIKSVAAEESCWERDASRWLVERMGAALADGVTVDKHWFADRCWSRPKVVSA